MRDLLWWLDEADQRCGSRARWLHPITFFSLVMVVIIRCVPQLVRLAPPHTLAVTVIVILFFKVRPAV